MNADLRRRFSADDDLHRARISRPDAQVAERAHDLGRCSALDVVRLDRVAGLDKSHLDGVRVRGRLDDQRRVALGLPGVVVRLHHVVAGVVLVQRRNRQRLQLLLRQDLQPDDTVASSQRILTTGRIAGEGGFSRLTLM